VALPVLQRRNRRSRARRRRSRCRRVAVGDSGAWRAHRHPALPGALLAAWIAYYLAGLEHPAHPVSTLGRRDQCIWQAVLFRLPSLALMLWYARRLMALWPRTTGMLAGAAAAAVPAAIMQVACMYAPSHILTHHIGPLFIVAAPGALLGRVTLRQRPTIPRGRGLPMH